MHGADDNPNLKNHLVRENQLVISEILDNPNFDIFSLREILKERTDLFKIEENDVPVHTSYAKLKKIENQCKKSIQTAENNSIHEIAGYIEIKT